MKLFYREKGNSQLPSLIIWHGLWGASENWLPVAEHLSPYFHVVLPDFRNHGKSPHSEQHDYDVLSEDILAFIKQFSYVQKPFLAGHSMGGKALMLALLKSPGIAAKAAVMDICPKAYNTTGESIHTFLLNFICQHPFIPLFSRSGVHQWIREQIPSPEMHQILFKNLQKTNNGFGWKVNGTAIRKNWPLLMSWPVLDTTRKYNSPVLFIKGENSDYIQSADIPQLLSLFPSAKLTMLSAASHYLHSERPQDLARILIDFFLTEPAEVPDFIS